MIRLQPEARWFADYYPTELIEESASGGLTVRFSASSPVVAARLLLRLGPSGELLEGDEVGAEVAELRKRILTRYRG